MQKDFANYYLKNVMFYGRNFLSVKIVKIMSAKTSSVKISCVKKSPHLRYDLTDDIEDYLERI